MRRLLPIVAALSLIVSASSAWAADKQKCPDGSDMPAKGGCKPKAAAGNKTEAGQLTQKATPPKAPASSPAASGSKSGSTSAPASGSTSSSSPASGSGQTSTSNPAPASSPVDVCDPAYIKANGKAACNRKQQIEACPPTGKPPCA